VPKPLDTHQNNGERLREPLPRYHGIRKAIFMQLIHFDADTVDEMNVEFLTREIDFVDVVNVETYYHIGDNAHKYPKYQVWYWYRSDLIT